MVVLGATTDLRAAIGFSSFGVLVYYLVANLSALRQQRAHLRHPAALALGGAIGCVILAATLPPDAVAVGVIVLVMGLVGRAATRRPSATRSAAG